MTTLDEKNYRNLVEQNKKKDIYIEGLLKQLKKKRKVLIEVRGGVAECSQCPDDVIVKIKDHDNR